MSLFLPNAGHALGFWIFECSLFQQEGLDFAMAFVSILLSFSMQIGKKTSFLNVSLVLYVVNIAANN